MEHPLPPLVIWASMYLLYSSRIHRFLTVGDKVNSVCRPASRSLAAQYDNPMPELTLSHSQESMNSATGSRKTEVRRREKDPRSDDSKKAQGLFYIFLSTCKHPT
jgi:hypothetical protein